MSALVAIVGRPNVGKSTLFNRLVGYSRAIVDDTPGVTRDRNYASIQIEDRPMTLVDTGGFEPTAEEGLFAQMRAQTLLAVEEADLTVLLMDGKAGLSPHDRDLVEVLRRSGRPFLLVVNKIDSPEREDALADFFALGVEPVLPISAAHGYGMQDFTAALAERLPTGEEAPEREDLIRVAVIGRPNVGKSSLVNQLLGQERALVHETPGTTRDPVDVEVTHGGRHYLFVDTAGIRKKGRVSAKIEKFSVMRALRSMDRCDVALLLIDSPEGVTDQDAHVAGYALERGRGLILVFNKWDLIDNEKEMLKTIKTQMDLKLRFLTFAPVLTVSALTGMRVQKLYRLIEEVYDQYSVRVPTGQLNRLLEQVVQEHTPPYVGRQRLKFYYATQASTRPPTFVLFVNRPSSVHFSYRRFLVNRFRAAFGLDKTAIRIFFRERKGRRKEEGDS